MRALSLHQPWAQAVVLDEKSIETRSWQTSYRGPLAIHATKSMRHAQASDDQLERPSLVAEFTPIPLGALVGSVYLYDCLPVEEVRDDLSGTEFRWGDYSDGRFAWLLHRARVLPRPIPCRGALGLWRLSDELSARVEREAVEPGMIKVTG